MGKATKKQLQRIEQNNRDYRKEQPCLVELEKLLLEGGGKAVVLLFEDDCEAIINKGEWWDSDSVEMLGEPSQCHRNVACLYEANEGRVAIVTGWALSDDGLWRQHSWGFDYETGSTVETTEPREAYFGFLLSDAQAQKFAWDQIL